MSKTLTQTFAPLATTKKVIAGLVLAAAMTLFGAGMAGATNTPAQNGNGNGYGGGDTIINVEGDMIVIIIQNLNNYFF